MIKNWSAYNLAQQNEVFLFLDRLPEAVIQAVGNRDLWKGIGRPPRKLYDILICLAIQDYVGFSDRRSMGIIELFTRFARIPLDMPCYRSLSNYKNDPMIRPYMENLIEVTSKPLSVIERDFSTDATGVSTKTFSSWYSIRVGKKTERRDHIISHVTTSRILNAAVAVDVDCDKGKDSQYLREHVQRVRNNFLISDWSGDSAYLARANCNAVSGAGGTPWFRVKKNTTAKPRMSPSWKRMVKEFKEDPDNAGRHYHKRSNSESTFSAKKRKFGSSVRSKNCVAKENEEYMKWVDYNFTVLCRAWYEFGINPKFG
jgi:transposase